MPCTNCGGPQLPDCASPVSLLCVRNSESPFPVHAWAIATCVAGSVTEINLFSDAAGTIPLVGYTLQDQVPCSQDMEQITAPILDRLNDLIEVVIANAEVNYSYGSMVYDGADNLLSIRRTPPSGPVQEQTYTYVDGNLATISAWENVP